MTSAPIQKGFEMGLSTLFHYKRLLIVSFPFPCCPVNVKVHYVNLKFIAKNTSVFYQQNSSNQDYMFSLGDGKQSVARPPIDRPWWNLHACSNVLRRKTIALRAYCLYFFFCLSFCSLMTLTWFTGDTPSVWASLASLCPCANAQPFDAD